MALEAKTHTHEYTHTPLLVFRLHEKGAEGGDANPKDDGKGKGKGKSKGKKRKRDGAAGDPQQPFDARKVLKVTDTIRVGVNNEDNESTVEVGLGLALVGDIL